MHEVWASDLAPMIFVAAFAVTGVLLYPLARGIGRRLSGETGADGGEELGPLTDEIRALRNELADLRGRLDDAAGYADRVVELEERLDFAERVLARGDEPPRLPGERH